MDVDAFSAAHRGQWHRLDELVGTRRLRPHEVDELVVLYRGATADLAQVRAGAADPALVAELSRRVARARGRLSVARMPVLTGLQHLVVVRVPAALYRLRWWVLAATAAFVLVALVTAAWTLRSPVAMQALGSQRELDLYAQRAFAAYYSRDPAEQFAATVWTHNARVAVTCLAAGVTGLVPAGLLVLNAVSLGQAAAVMADHDALGVFVALVCPHGLAELTCVIIAVAGGTRLFWTALVPGDLPRLEALAQEGRRTVDVAVAVVVALGGCGLIEAFVTPADVPWPLKVGVGASAVALLWAYTLVLGRRAVSDGAVADSAVAEGGGDGEEGPGRQRARLRGTR